MKQLLQFIQNHWALSSAFGVVLILIIFEEFKKNLGGLPKISTRETTMFLNHKHGIVIDSRDIDTFAQGHIIGSLNILPKDIEHHDKKITAHKNNPIIIISNNDTNAATVGNKLKQQGCTKIYILDGGIEAWQSAQLPLTKNK